MVATETVGPFDGTPWAQDQWYRFAATWAPSGVIDAPQASTSAGGLGLSFNGLTPTLAAGRAWVRGGGYELAGGSKTLSAVPANTNVSLSRRDRLVLRRDVATKTITPVQLQGTPASSPVAPALQQVETGQWDLPLFSWITPPNSGTAITGITEERRWVDPNGGQRFVQEGYVLAPTYADPLLATSNILIKASNYSAVTDAIGVLLVPFATPFPNGVINVTPTGITTAVSVPLNCRSAVTVAGFSIVCLDLNGQLLRNTGVDITYIAYGW